MAKEKTKEEFDEEGWETISAGAKTDEMWDRETPNPITGCFIERREGVGENNSNLYVLEVDGKNVGVWGSVVLDDMMSKIGVGDIVRIKCLGREKSEKGGRSYYTYEVSRKANFEPVKSSKQEDISEEVDEVDVEK